MAGIPNRQREINGLYNTLFGNDEFTDSNWETTRTGMHVDDTPNVEVMIPGTAIRAIGCPACAYDYVHIGSVSQDHSEYPADSQFRGSITRIHFWCEGGHLFDLVLQEHKGQVFTHVDNVRDEPDG